MGVFVNIDKFTKEFAYRTMYNYYDYLAYKRESRSEKEQDGVYTSKKLKVLEMMRANGYNASGRYEVTALINSFMGLLVFPEQTWFDELEWETFENHRLPLLKEIVNNPNTCTSTYKKIKYHKKGQIKIFDCEIDEEKTLQNVLKHMRNCLCHDRLLFYPEQADGQDEILGFTFVDEREVLVEGCKYKEYTSNSRKPKGTQIHRFELRISVEEAEDVIMEICNFLVSFDEKGEK